MSYCRVCIMSDPMTQSTLIREESGLYYVRFETPRESEPMIATGFYPVSFDLSIDLDWLLGRAVVDASFQGIYRADFARLAPNELGLRARDARAILMHLARTESERVTYAPAPSPKVRKGQETRWYRQRWEKLTKKGWVWA